MRPDHEEQDCRFGNKNGSASDGNRGLNRENTLLHIDATKQHRWDRKDVSGANGKCSWQNSNPTFSHSRRQGDSAHGEPVSGSQRISRDRVHSYHNKDLTGFNRNVAYDPRSLSRPIQSFSQWRDVDRNHK